MAIQTSCPGCGTIYTLDDRLAGKKGRCKTCREFFIIGGAAAVQVIHFEEVPDELSPDDDSPVRKRRKKARKESANSLIIGLGIALAVLILLGGGGLVWLLAGGGHRGPQLVGKWKGAPQVKQALDEVAKDKNLHPVAKDFAGVLIQKAADKLLAVTIIFKDNGIAFFSGNTDALGVPAESDGPWEILQADGDIVTVRMGPADKPFEFRLAFRDKNTFALTRVDHKDSQPMVFTREKD